MLPALARRIASTVAFPADIDKASTGQTAMQPPQARHFVRFTVALGFAIGFTPDNPRCNQMGKTERLRKHSPNRRTAYNLLRLIRRTADEFRVQRVMRSLEFMQGSYLVESQAVFPVGEVFPQRAFNSGKVWFVSCDGQHGDLDRLVYRLDVNDIEAAQADAVEHHRAQLLPMPGRLHHSRNDLGCIRTINRHAASEHSLEVLAAAHDHADDHSRRITEGERRVVDPKNPNLLFHAHGRTTPES